MSSQGPNYGSTYSQISFGGSSWANLSNLSASDGAFATNTVHPSNGANVLVAQGFGFSIPTGATIDGILVEIQGKADATVGGGGNGQLIKTGTTGTGSTFSFGSASGWTTTNTIFSMGGSTNLWGTTWSPSDVNGSDFGIRIDVGFYPNHLISVDAIRFTVYYTGGTTTYNQECDTSTTLSQTRVLQVGKPVAAPVTPQAQKSNGLSRFLNAAVTTVGNLFTQTGVVQKTLTAVAHVTPYITNVVADLVMEARVHVTPFGQFGMQLVAAVQAVASDVAQWIPGPFSKVLGATVTTTAKSSGALSKLFENAVQVAIDLPRETDKTLSGGVTAIVAMGRGFYENLLAAVTTHATIQRIVSLNRLGVVTPVANVARRVNKNLSGGAALVADTGKNLIRQLTASVATSTSVIHIKAFLKNLNATIATSPTLIRSVGRSIYASVTPLSDVTRTINLHLANGIALLASVRNTIGRTLNTSVHAVTGLLRAVQKVCGGIVSTAASYRSLLMKELESALYTLASLDAHVPLISRLFEATVSAQTSVSNTISKRFTSSVSLSSLSNRIYGFTKSASLVLSAQLTRAFASLLEIHVLARGNLLKTAQVTYSSVLATSASLVKNLNRNLASTVGTVTSSVRQTSKTIENTLSLFVQTGRGISKRIENTVTLVTEATRSLKENLNAGVVTQATMATVGHVLVFFRTFQASVTTTPSLVSHITRSLQFYSSVVINSTVQRTLAYTYRTAVGLAPSVARGLAHAFSTGVTLVAQLIPVRAFRIVLNAGVAVTAATARQAIKVLHSLLEIDVEVIRVARTFITKMFDQPKPKPEDFDQFKPFDE
jgi:hypothetical protein